MKSLFGLIAMAMIIAGCNSGDQSSTHRKQAKEIKTVTQKQKKWQEPTKATVDTSKTYKAIIKTSKGTITCQLYADHAPLSVTNFKYLADSDFYDGLTFHRVEPGFVIQGGDPTATGAGGPGYTISEEIGQKHVKGALAWARTGDQVNPERRSSGSQFYITLAPTPFLDNNYTVFGHATDGMDVVAQIARGDVIEDIQIIVE